MSALELAETLCCLLAWADSSDRETAGTETRGNYVGAICTLWESALQFRRMPKANWNRAMRIEMLHITNTRPVPVTILSWLCSCGRAIGFITTFSPELIALHRDSVLTGLTEFLIFSPAPSALNGRNWARWLALVWMAFHVAISFPPLRQAAIHFYPSP